MAVRDLDAVFYASEAPNVEFREGMFHICYQIRRCNFEFVMSPNIFLKALRNANRVSDTFHEGTATITGIRRKKDIVA